tara:strand:+ start:6300 stop:7166 length:867 start_codon:yes stop_codon:yes gene_type:complete
MKYIKYFIQFLIIIFLFFIFKLLGYKNSSNFGANIGKLFGKAIRTDKIILKNLNIINNNFNFHFNDKNKIVKNVFSNYGRILSDYIYLSKFKNGILKNYINIEGINYLEDIKSNNKKVVFVSGHFNNFELMAMTIDSFGINLAAIYRPLNNIFLNKIMENIRKKYICANQIKKGRTGTRDLLKFINKNYSIALMIDQRVSEGISCKLFGKEALTTTIPAQIIKKYNYEIVPVYIKRRENIKFDLTIEKPIKFEKDLSIEKITLKLNEILEQMILKNPSQWILTHNRWK